MEPFITYKERDQDGIDKFYILQRKFPHYQAVILDYLKIGAIATAPVAGHHLYVTFSGTIQGSYVLAKSDVARELSSLLEIMAQWYYEKMVAPNPKKYKKFKI